MIHAQIEAFQPLGVSLRKPAAQRLASKSLILLGELICWLIFLASVVACLFLNRLYPFTGLFDLGLRNGADGFTIHDGQMLRLCVYGALLLAGFGFLLLARSLAFIRKKNSILHMAGAQIKTLVGQHLERKAAIDAIDQRHFGDMLTPVPGQPVHSSDINAIPNPGFDANEANEAS